MSAVIAAVRAINGVQMWKASIFATTLPNTYHAWLPSGYPDRKTSPTKSNEEALVSIARAPCSRINWIADRWTDGSLFR
jgi:hypothetical protein